MIRLLGNVTSREFIFLDLDIWFVTKIWELEKTCAGNLKRQHWLNA